MTSNGGKILAFVPSFPASVNFLLSVFLLGCTPFQTGFMQIKGHVDEALGKCDRIWVSGDVDLPLLVRGGGRVVAPADPDHRAGHLPDLGNLGPALPDHRPDQLVGNGHLESRLTPLDPRSKSTFLAVPDLVPADLAPGNTCDRGQRGAAISETEKAGD